MPQVVSGNNKLRAEFTKACGFYPKNGKDVTSAPWRLEAGSDPYDGLFPKDRVQGGTLNNQCWSYIMRRFLSESRHGT
jgi:hypothetical protein